MAALSQLRFLLLTDCFIKSRLIGIPSEQPAHSSNSSASTSPSCGLAYYLVQEQRCGTLEHALHLTDVRWRQQRQLQLLDVNDELHFMNL